jgi:hypothetical protein
MLLLGPMPDAVRLTVRNLVETARSEHSDPKSPFLGFLLWGGPGGCDFLDAEGEAWSWSVWDDAVERIPDGPRKVGGVAIAAERIPELADWLPRRPASAADCQVCKMSGWLQPPLPRLLCPECSGMGWLSK